MIKPCHFFWVEESKIYNDVIELRVRERNGASRLNSQRRERKSERRVKNGCMDEGSYQQKGVEKFEGEGAHYGKQLLEDFF